MIKFSPSDEKDILQIQNWTDLDVYHHGQNSPEWWLTGNGLLSFCLRDDRGPVFYVRLDKGEYARLSVQFAPKEVVSKMRLARAMIETLPRLKQVAKSDGSKGIIFDSISPSLVRFMEKLGFFKVEDDSYLLLFGE